MTFKIKRARDKLTNIRVIRFYFNGFFIGEYPEQRLSWEDMCLRLEKILSMAETFLHRNKKGRPKKRIAPL